MPELIVIGGGLAGSEAAWQAAEHGICVKLFEMRPGKTTGAHVSANLAELVCSNSLGSNLIDRASGLLKEELRRLNSLLIQCAEKSAVPAGGALAVDRSSFSELVTKAISQHPKIRVFREEVVLIPNCPVIIASGPLSLEKLSISISELTGQDHLYFYDAIAPVISAESINYEVAFRASRYSLGNLEEGDYINCPLTREEYEGFVDALLAAERIPLREFELDIENGVRAGFHHFFEGCLPIEVLAMRGKQALAFGPMRPVGLIDPRTGRRPYAVIQLRQDNFAGSLFNLVGFQTNITFKEQQRIFRMIPGLEKAVFVRFGQMHRNTFIFSPALLSPSMQFRLREDIFFAGQITGVEGYMGNIATGLLAGRNAARYLSGLKPLVLPPTTLIGALCRYVTQASEADFQPMKANYGLLNPLEGVIPRGKRERCRSYSQRSLSDLDEFLMKEAVC